MTIDYETCKITLKMTAPEFEAVFETLQEFVNFAPDTAVGISGTPNRKAIIKGLKFTFEQGSGEPATYAVGDADRALVRVATSSRIRSREILPEYEDED